MKLIQKISIAIIGICLLISSSINTCYAVNINTDHTFVTTNIYKGLSYDGKTLEIPITIKKINEQEIPIYQIKRKNIEAIFAEDATKEYILNDEEVRRILLLGYPNAPIEKLNCNSEEEAYIITQIAILNVHYQYDIEKFSVEEENKYPNIISKIENFIMNIDRYIKPKEMPEFGLEEETTMWNENETTYSNRYRISSYTDFKKYEVQLTRKNKENIQMRNEQGEAQETFLATEKFKLYYPKNENIEFELSIKVTFETQPVKVGKRLDKIEEYYVYLNKSEEIEQSYVRYYRNGKEPEIVKPKEPFEPEPEEPSTPIEPELPIEPTPVEPTDPEKPINPNPVESVEPTPTEPTISEEPSKPEPTNPISPTPEETNQTTPTIPEQSNQQSKPIQTTTPEQSNKPNKQTEEQEAQEKPNNQVQESQVGQTNKTEESKSSTKPNESTSSTSKKESSKQSNQSSQANQNKKLPKTGC